MKSDLKLKILLVFLLVIFSSIALLPSVYPGVPDWWKKYLAPAGLKLGLDLQGGMHVVMEVNLEKAAENSLELSASDLKAALAEQNIHIVRIDSGDPKKVLKEKFSNLDTKIDAESGSFPRIALQLKWGELDYIQKNAVNQTLEILRNRIDQFGVAEPIVLRQGDNQIVIQLPGVKDSQLAMDLIGQTALLEFKKVADAPGVNLPLLINETIKSGQWREGESRKQLNLALQSRLPKGMEVYFEKIVDNGIRLYAHEFFLFKFFQTCYQRQYLSGIR
jgi:SecD/SecF fusion protein